MEPTWLLRETVLTLHEQSLALFGGLAGIRDEVMLDSALKRPEDLWYYSKPTLPELSASYAFGLAKNHPFFDGNKRIAFLAAVTFLEVNGRRFKGSEVEAILNTLALAAGELDEKGFAAWLEVSSTAPTS
ncbi:type II toxin-antitoxin system death-on-curing family toxin [Synoicihabitans lomoniglobus]|uniref:Type II toxin-antitoxin system death-on-curing family toxin n=1 Tax=Synoicihabitans lomoniglobus TaxID=2909285 RepID=A0AAF0CRS1_9BACT|nr:type II toxin-antitoxin system death-on-curing family toxin [Opitutaceae bacterium LMO-M01]WED66893.1 type II toxin-antitoxin system death-on-curing family toxin [Opitutaceae bacterium LMO-M01]